MKYETKSESALRVAAALAVSQLAIQFKDEGNNVSTPGAFSAMNFVGTGLIATDGGSGTLLLRAPTSQSFIDNTVGTYANASAVTAVRTTTTPSGAGPTATFIDTAAPFTQAYIGDTIAITLDTLAVHTTTVIAASAAAQVDFADPLPSNVAPGKAVVITRPNAVNPAAYYLVTCAGIAGNTETVYVGSGFTALQITDTLGTGSSSEFSSAGTSFASMATAAPGSTSVVRNLVRSSLLIGGTDTTSATGGTLTCEVTGAGSILCGLATLTANNVVSTLANAGSYSLLLGASNVGAALTGNFNISSVGFGVLLMGYSEGGTVTQGGIASAAFVYCGDKVGTSAVSISGIGALTRLVIPASGMAYTSNATCANIAIVASGGAPTVSITGLCSTLSLNTAAAPTVTVSGGSATGFINSSGASTILLSGSASLTNVVINSIGSVTASGAGTRVQGRNASTTAGVTLSATGIAASARAYLLAGATANATATGDASRAEGYVPGAFALTASGRCSLAWGDTTLGAISATGINSVQFFPGANAVAQSIQFGAGIRIHAPTPATGAFVFPVGPYPAGVANGSIWVDAIGQIVIFDAANPAGRLI